MREQILELFRRMQSEQTGFIHLHYQELLGERHDTIPLVENFLFALSLLRSRTAEQMLEARELLHKLLPFQSREGNFPVYLHDYPNCKELLAGVKILPALYWILKDFGTVVGAEVKECFKRLLAYCRSRQEDAPLHLAILIQAFEGDLEKFNDEKYWYSPTMLGALIIALQINPERPWPKFWRHLQETWHPKAMSYVAPHFYDLRYEASPFATLYQTFMRGTLTDHPYSLYAVLLLPQELERVDYPIVRSGSFDFTHTAEAASYFVPRTSQEGIPYQLLYLDGAKSHTLRLKADSQVEKRGERYHFFFEPEQVDQFSLELDTGEETAILINGGRATVFQMGESVEIATATKKVRLTFAKEEGAGNVLGHLSMLPPREGHSRKWVFSLRMVAVPAPVQVSLGID